MVGAGVVLRGGARFVLGSVDRRSAFTQSPMPQPPKGSQACTEPQILDLFIHDLEVRFNETPFFNPPSGGSTLPFRKGHSAGNRTSIQCWQIPSYALDPSFSPSR
ncbi:hypothetical protein BA193_19170 [Yersinia pseudotuberculosis]|nr:hypothetical protein BA193_19170 [Yersinia pseudotuberculosis]